MGPSPAQDQLGSREWRLQQTMKMPRRLMNEGRRNFYLAMHLGSLKCLRMYKITTLTHAQERKCPMGGGERVNVLGCLELSPSVKK